MRRLGIRIANTVLFVVCCYAAAGLFNKISSEVLAPVDETQGLPVATAPASTPRSASRAREINQRNLFGSSVRSQQVAVREPDPEPVTTVTKLPLKLLGTAAFENDSEASRAAIGDRGGKEPEVLAIGDALTKHPSVTVAAISAGEVILDNRGNREVLRLDDENGKDSSPKARRSSRSSRRGRDRNARSSRGSSRGTSKLVDNLRKLADQTARSGEPPDLLTQAQVLPKYENGEMVGIELSAIQGGSFYEQIGLKNGDVISEVNGAKIDSPTVSQEIIASLADVPEIFAVVNGRPFMVPAHKLAELMESGGLGQ